jgi:hypothetical protein
VARHRGRSNDAMHLRNHAFALAALAAVAATT